MSKITTHLHLALKLLNQYEIDDSNSFYLGCVYPDFWNESVLKSIESHYKKEPYDQCDLNSFLKKHDLKDEFDFGY